MSWPAPEPWAAARTTTGRRGQVAGPLERRHDQGLAAVGLLAAVEQVQRLDDPAAGLVLLERDRLLVEPGLGVGRRVPAVGHGHPAQVLAGRSGGVEIALRRHGHPRGRRQQPDRQVGRHVRVLRVGERGPALHAGAEAAARALVEGAVTDDDVGHPGGDGQRRLLNGGAGRAAAVVDAAEEAQLADAQAARDVDVGVGVRAEGDHALHLGRRQTGLLQRQVHRLHGQAQLGAPRGLGELGGPDAGDGHPAGERVRHQAPPPSLVIRAAGSPSRCRSRGRPGRWPRARPPSPCRSCRRRPAAPSR